MSESNIKSEVVADAQVESEFVPKKAYIETQNDMHKFKARAKETEAKLNQLLAEKDLADKQALEANQQWELLYKKEQAEKSNLLAARESETKRFIDFHKKQAVLNHLGGFKRDEYSNFINLEKIQVDENGDIIAESRDAEVSRIKQMYPELIKGSEAASLPTAAAKSLESTMAPKEFNAMTEKERHEYFISQITKTK